MSKLWIVHRHARRRHALARITGLPRDALVVGGPEDETFGQSEPPVALLIALEDDFELELDFLHRHRDRLEDARRLLLVGASAAGEACRLTGARPEEILDERPDPRALKTLLQSAFARRRTEPLFARRERQRLLARFANWFGGGPVPGLSHAIDPGLASLPLLVRGVPGSGRALAARYAELCRVRGSSGTILRLDARELSHADEVGARLAARRTPVGCVWIDEIDALPSPLQSLFAEWIRLDASPFSQEGPGGGLDGPLRWVATAGPVGLHDRLEPSLALAFTPLAFELPPLVDNPEELDRFAGRVAAAWASRVGGSPRPVSAEALEALEAHAWTGDRAAVEASLHRALAATSEGPLQPEDLVTPTDLSGANVARAASAHDAATAAPGWTGAPPAQADFAAAPVLAPLTSAAPEEPASAQSGESTADFERAFLSGLPEVTAEVESDATLESDLSVQMSEASFVRASEDRTGGTTAPAEDADKSWRRLARSLSHEIKNPLVSIRTFAELLPEHFADASFRERFTELVGRDVAHIDEVISRLAKAAAREKPEKGPCDVSALIERLLDDRREAIGRRRLLVLRELERDAPIAWADAESLELALSGLLDRALAALPERGDLFVATRRTERGSSGEPQLRILLRHHNPELAGAEPGRLVDVGVAANVIEYVLAETLIEGGGGRLTIDSTDSQETLILVDLPSPT